MEEVKQPVTESGSSNTEAPRQNGVENQNAVDYTAELKAKDEKIQQLQRDRDNYRTGMLKYKKQAESEESPTVTDEDRFRQIAREELMSSELARANADKEELVKKMAKELSEAKIAMANKSQISTMPGGSSQPQDNYTVEKLASDQKAQLEEQARMLGVDSKKYIDNFLKNWEKTKNK